MTTPNADRGDATPLSPERWAQVRAAVEAAVALPGTARAALLDASCGGDEALRRRVERLIETYERASESWEFLASPAGGLAAPLLAADGSTSVDPAARAEGAPAAFRAALAERYAVGAEIGRGGMATVYVAEDLRHHRRVAIKVLEPRFGAMLGADRFLSEIRVTAGLRHPNLLPLFDSGEAGGLLYYVMPLIDGSTLRARLQRERQLPVDEAVRIVRIIAGALDYAHRQGVVHRDLKPENILLQDGQPLVADFGISMAVASPDDSRSAGDVITLGTPRYMSPEQAAGDPAVDGRSDIYSLASVLYELLVGDPPFTGTTVQAVIARVLRDRPVGVRRLRPSVPAPVAAAIAKALGKRPADRYATAREFADALDHAPAAAPTTPRANASGWRSPSRIAIGAVATIALASAAWMASRTNAAATDVTRIRFHNLVDQTLFSSVTITPNGRALVYTGTAEAGRPIMVQPLDALAPRALPGTEGGIFPFVSPDGRQLLFSGQGVLRTVSIDGVASGRVANAWRYGNGAWAGGSGIVTEGGLARGLARTPPGGDTAVALTRPDSARGESRHRAPLVLPDQRAVVFTVTRRGIRGQVTGPLAIASLDSSQSPSRHVWLGVEARHAVAVVDGWLLFTSVDGLAIMAVRLDVDQQRIIGTPVLVLEDEAGNLETAALADNGTLLYVRRPRVNSPVLVDSTGEVRPLVANPRGSVMYPRISPNGKRLAVQATIDGDGNDVWLFDVATGSPTRLTTTGRALHPAWMPDGNRIIFMRDGRGLMSTPVDGSAEADTVPETDGGFGPAVSVDGKSVVYQRASASGWSVWSASPHGERAARKVVNDRFAHYMPVVSPDGQWLADVSSETGRNEVYVRPFSGPGAAVQASDSGGTEPAWSPDGRRIYYRIRGAFMAVDVTTTPALAIASRRQLFEDTFDGAMPHRNYDVMPDGSGFVMITGGTSEAVVVLNWLSELRARLATAR